MLYPLKEVENLTGEGTCHNDTANRKQYLKCIDSSVVISAYIRNEINPSFGIKIWSRYSFGVNHSKAPFESTGLMLLTLAEGLFHLLLFNCR